MMWQTEGREQLREWKVNTGGEIKIESMADFVAAPNKFAKFDGTYGVEKEHTITLSVFTDQSSMMPLNWKQAGFLSSDK